MMKRRHHPISDPEATEQIAPPFTTRLNYPAALPARHEFPSQLSNFYSPSTTTNCYIYPSNQSSI